MNYFYIHLWSTLFIFKTQQWNDINRNLQSFRYFDKLQMNLNLFFDVPLSLIYISMQTKHE